MKKTIIFMFLFLMSINFVFAQPPMPCAYYGEVTLNNQPISNGYSITAKIKNEIKAECPILEGRYGYDDNLCIVNTFEEDARVNFYICNELIEDSAFRDRGVINLNLDLESLSCEPIYYCGDGKCNNGETCSTCPEDCGVCQTDSGSSGGGGSSGGSSGGGGSSSGSFGGESLGIQVLSSGNNASSDDLEEINRNRENTSQQKINDFNQEKKSLGLTGKVIENLKSPKGISLLILGLILILVVLALVDSGKNKKHPVLVSSGKNKKQKISKYR